MSFFSSGGVGDITITDSVSRTPEKEIQRILDFLQQAEDTARSDISGSFEEAMNIFNETEAKLTEFTRPAVEANRDALSQLSKVLGIGDNPLTAEERQDLFENTPGYQFQFDQGQQAVERSNSARGLLESGAVLKDLSKFGQGLAHQSFGDYQNQLINVLNSTSNQVLGQQGAIQNLGVAKAGLGQEEGAQLAGIAERAGAQRASSLQALATRYNKETSMTLSPQLGGKDINQANRFSNALVANTSTAVL